MTPVELEKMTLCDYRGREGELFVFEKEGRKARVEGFEQPRPATTKLQVFVDAQPVLEAFGAAVSVTTFNGHDRVEIVPAPPEAETAR